MGGKTYNSLVSELLAGAELNELGPGNPGVESRPLLDQLTDASLVAPHQPRDPDAAWACCAGLWLRYNFLSDSHRISQDLETPEGSYWHGIMHRREGDFDNAMYWFRRVGSHPVFDELAAESLKLVGKILPDSSETFLSDGNCWAPDRFNDLCRQSAGTGSDLEQLCREVQRREWDLLFDFCYRHAAAV
jgi:hypothetical protein